MTTTIKSAVKTASKLAGEAKNLTDALKDVNDVLMTLGDDLASEVTIRMGVKDSEVTHSAHTGWRRLGVSVARLFFCDAYITNDVVEGKILRKLRFVGRPHLVKIADSCFEYLVRSIKHSTHGNNLKTSPERDAMMHRLIGDTVIALTKQKLQLLLNTEKPVYRDTFANEEVATVEHFIANGIVPATKVVSRALAQAA